MINGKRITILLVEDHHIVREGLKTLLETESDMTVVGEAGNGFDAITMSKELEPMIVVMDIALPKLNGIEAARQILQDHPSMKILVLSAYDDDGFIEKMAALGVSGFLLKQCAPDMLIDAIREILKGKTFFSSTISKRLVQLNKNPLQVHGSKLSAREQQVLQLITAGKANKEVAFELEISIKTVEKHRQSIMKKLSIHDMAGLTRYAIAEGILESGRKKNII